MIVIFSAFLCSWLLLSQSASPRCLLLAFPGGEVGREKNANLSDIRVVTVNSEVEFAIASFVVSTLGNVTGGECSEVIGVVGDVDSKTAGILHTLASRSNLSLTIVSAVAPSTFLPVTHLPLPNVLDMRPLSHYLQAIVSFIQQWNWTRIGLISDDSYYYQYATELLQKKLRNDPSRFLTPFLTVSGYSNHTKTIQSVREYGTHVVIISADVPTTCALLREADNSLSLWPEYAWLVANLASGESILNCDAEGFLVVKDRPTSFPEKEGLGGLSGDFCDFSRTVCDAAVLTIALARNATTFAETATLLSHYSTLKDSSTNLSIVLKQHPSLLELAEYDPKIEQLHIHHDILENASPQGHTRMVSDQHSPLFTSVVITTSLLTFLFVTLIFALYVYFRKEPEIKATSVSVSISMFAGCYMLISFSLLLVADDQMGLSDKESVTSNMICFLLTWLSALGLPFVMILATLFVKMLRVYIIFCSPTSYRKRFFSNTSLMLYIVLIMSPNILLLTAWSAVDPCRSYTREVVLRDSILVADGCRCAHFTSFLPVLLLYLGILVVAVATLSLKTSKIRYKNFRDTKATNAFTFLVILVGLVTVSYASVFNAPYDMDSEASVNIRRANDVNFLIGHTSVALLCQIFLFVPKVYPPIRRLVHKEGK